MSAPGSHAAQALALAPTALPGVGPARAAALARLGLTSLRALLCLVPRRLERSGERRSARAAAGVVEGEVAVLGTLRGLRLFRAGRRRSVLALEVVDESGALRALFFNQPWLFERLRALAVAGKRVELVGRIGRTQQGPALLAPRCFEDPPAERVPGFVPVYPTTAGLGQELLRRLITATFERHGALLDEPLTGATLAELGVPPLATAVRALHWPESRAEFVAARRRLALERLLGLQARLAHASARWVASQARALPLDEAARRALCAHLPFEPTAGQAQVLTEILDDLARPRPMRRLLQGEVGAGKTLVALAACAAAARGGGQAALLAPTELLAEQHFLGLQPAFARFDLCAVLLTGSLRAPARQEALRALASGRAQLAIGTHALLSSTVTFARLDLCVIDEQQRFGVAQKRALLEKGAAVHALLMTATPIPRTLALCYYGDLETSLLRERPPGRGSVQTRVLKAGQRQEVVRFLLERTQAGERAFWVCPRIDADDPESDRGNSAVEAAAVDHSARGSDPQAESRAESISAERVFARLQKGALAGTGLALLHGRLTPERRLEAIERFRSGAARVLVATSMVEVGVDVPEATVMVIEGCERFGLSQLHQLRGRVGRSARPSWCFLIAAEPAGRAAPGEARARFLEHCSDGFAIAEEDLRRRGMGDLTGLRQAGENLEGLGEEGLELELVRQARALVRSDPELLAHYLAEGREAALV